MTELRLHQTTVYISNDVREQIKKRGMTVSGAFAAGWEAIQDRIKYAARIEQLEQNEREMQANIRGYQRMVQEALGAKK